MGSKSVPTSVKVFALRVALAAIAVPLVACVSSSPGAGGRTPTPPAAPTSASLIDQVAALIRAPHVSIKASDGRAELLLPSGSLPAGTALSNIKITKLNPVDASIRFDRNPPLFAYRLEPDGLQFATQPVLRLSVDLPPSGRLPLLFTDSGSRFSRLRPIATEVDLVNRQVTFTARLAHFSDAVGTAGWFTVTLSELQDHVWGDPFQMKAVITQVWWSQITAHRLYGTTIESFPSGQVWLHGEWYGHDITPSVVKDAPPVTALGSHTFTVLQSFSCRGIGYKSSVDYVASLRYPLTSVGKGVEEDPAGGQDWERISVSSGQRQCKRPVSPISAAFDQSQFTTTYTVEVKEVPTLGKGTWYGPNCDRWETKPDLMISEGTKKLTFVWHHPHPPCGATRDHLDVFMRISFPVLQPPGVRWVCEYHGAASGAGKECEYTQ